MATTNSNIQTSLSALQTFTPPKLPSTFKPLHGNQQQQKYNNPANRKHDHITLEQTKQIHACMLKTRFQNTHQIHFSDAFRVPSSQVAQYNFLISSYNKSNHPICALIIYAELREIDIEVDSFIVPSVLKACAQIKWIHIGQEIHGFAVKNGFDSDVYVGNALIQMYTECGFAGFAGQIFDKMSNRDAVSWSTMIMAYNKHKMLDQALELIKEMQYNLVKPSEIAMISMVNLFADIAKTELAKPMHAYVIKNSNIDHLSTNLTTSLIDMYVKSGNLAMARSLFDRLEEGGIAAYTTMIAGYLSCHKLEEGAKLSADMFAADIRPNEITLLSLVDKCGQVEALDFGKQLHCYALRNGFSTSLAVATSLIDMYGKCCDTRSAQTVFNGTARRDTMMWTALISAYARGQYIDATIKHLNLMRENGINPNQVTMVSLLSLCSEAGTLELGKWVHAYIDKNQIEFDNVLRAALVDMYAKCGDVDNAYEMFVQAKSRDIYMWNSMITGFGMHGFGVEALDLFAQMNDLNIKPNSITFIGLLHACSHAGMVTEGKRVFENMVNKYKLVPRIEHYGCMVDLLGRAAKLNEAYEMIQRMPMKPNAIIWSSLVAACKIHRNHKLGELAAKELLKLDPKNCGYNVLTSNIYAASNRWVEVAGVRAAMEDKGMKKEPGLSCIEANGSVHWFSSGDQGHPQFEAINDKLEEMMIKVTETGYKPETSVVLLNVDVEEKRRSLKYHSEKIAMAFGLISTDPGTPIRVVKNLRVCDDCHTVTKLLSKIYGRRIIVKDRNRFHHFANGSCSCGDYW